MGDFERRMWQRMIKACDDFLERGCDPAHLRDLSGSLEGNLAASEMKDRALIEEFYQLWGPFEIACALNAEMNTEIDEKRMRDQASKMKKFLNRTLDLARKHDPGAH